MSNTTYVVALTGLAGSGKSTVAEYLNRRYDFTRIRFADPLKAAMRALGLSEAEVEGDLKSKPSPVLCGKTPRHAMQTLGTEWGRVLIDQNFWINLWLRRIDGKPLVVVEDCRFENEFAAVRALGGVTWRVCRPTVGEAMGHVSETEQADQEVDFNLLNNRGIRELYTKTEFALRESKKLFKERHSVD